MLLQNQNKNETAQGDTQCPTTQDSKEWAESFVVPDKNGLPRVIIDKEGMTLASRSGNRRASMIFYPDTDDPEFVICEKDGNVRASFFMDRGGIPRLKIRDRRGESRVIEIFDDETATRMVILDEMGNAEFKAP